MKKFFQFFVVALAIVVLGAMSSSCSNVDPSSKKVAYVAEGSLKGETIPGMGIAQFQQAINNAVGSGYVEANDSKVIAACDNVDKSLKSNTKLEGTVNIIKKAYSGGSSTTVKTYKYQKSN